MTVDNKRHVIVIINTHITPFKKALLRAANSILRSNLCIQFVSLTVSYHEATAPLLEVRADSLSIYIYNIYNFNTTFLNIK